ncbi:uncharacterized protein LOC131077884 isoform X1 [Cryptomeria japonica]|uniref:uncharacterized protein LOC131077884 isoform X1 n=1 Tax=Cryptomeria japonica TaxID=3369 RepID=UPI0027DA1C94|nr:uncharacterized protein LOC131077884 isoform X1 [Cryptomeria japonica]XP_059075551.1 uncharacterized protein LOC131077884 isoform X1 [Cryptomeria japonica]
MRAQSILTLEIIQCLKHSRLLWRTRSSTAPIITSKQLSMARGASDSVSEVEQVGKGVGPFFNDILQRSVCHLMSCPLFDDTIFDPFPSASAITRGEDMVGDLNIVSSAASQLDDLSFTTLVGEDMVGNMPSQLIDQILNTKADKPDFDLGQLVAQIDALLANYDTQLKLPDLPTASEASNFVDPVSKHVKLIANQIRLYSGDKYCTSIGVLNVIIAIENIHWTAVGFLVLGAALEDVHAINKNREECLRLLMSMTDLSKAILQLQNPPDLKMELHTKLNKSIHLIVIGAILSGLQKQNKDFGRVFKTSMDGHELQQVRKHIDDICRLLISHISAPISEGLPSKAYQNNKQITVHPAMDALEELPKISALHKHSLSFLETNFPRKLLKCSPCNVEIHPLLSHHRMTEIQRMYDVQRDFQWRLELFRFSSFWFANFNLNREQLELSRLQWLAQLDITGSNLLDNHLSESELRFEASNSSHHPLNALPQHIKNLVSLQYFGLESTFRLSSSVINQISNANGADSSVVNQRASASVIDRIPNTKSTNNSLRDQIIDLFGITILDLEQNLNERRYSSPVVEQISNEKNASSSVIDEISNKNKTSSSEVNSITNIVRAGNSVIELLEMIGSNFSWSTDSSQEVLNLKNILFLPQHIGDLFKASDQNLQSTFHLPPIRDLSKLKVINLQNFICIRQQVKIYRL